MFGRCIYLNNIIPVILLKELIILPNQEIKIELNNRLSKQIIKLAIEEYENKLLVVSPIDTKEEEPSIDDLPNVGVIAKIKNKIELPNGNIRLTLRGIMRVVVNRYFTSSFNENILNCEYKQVELPKFLPSEESAIRRKLFLNLKEYIDSSDSVSNSVLTTVNKAHNLDSITDIITSFLPFNFEKKCEYMQNINPLNRGINLLNDLNEEIAIIHLDEKIDEKVRETLDENQRDFILREKIKAIKEELGEENGQVLAALEYNTKLEKLKIASSTKKKLQTEINKFSLLSETSPELGVLRNYLDWTINLPWNKETKEEKDEKRVQEKLNATHYGLNEIKERICEYVALKNKCNVKAPIICLIGPPGVGKTSIAMAIANALNRRFYKISVGGLNDSSELVGNRRTYLGSIPGKIIQGLKKVGSKNPVFLIDEVDKMIKDYHGDPASTLLEIIDPVQNKYFTDNYIEEPFDLSNVLFILTANYKENIPETILDRVEVINLNSYTIFEKIDIAKDYILPKISREYDIDEVKIKKEYLLKIIKNYTHEAGVRDLERVLSAIIRKSVIANKKTIALKDISEYLGKPKENEKYLSKGKYGEVNTLGVMDTGGFVAKVEVGATEGHEKVMITGCVGDVLRESVYVALDYLTYEFNLDFTLKNIHIHFLEAASKKNGPSAGVAIAVSLYSYFTSKSVPSDMAFTGELSLNGDVLKIGGLKEKLIAAYNNDIKTVFIPKKNEIDLDNVPNVVLDNLNIIAVNNFKELYTIIFK